MIRHSLSRKPDFLANLVDVLDINAMKATRGCWETPICVDVPAVACLRTMRTRCGAILIRPSM